MHTAADIALIVVIVSAVVRFIARFVCRRAVTASGEPAPGLFDSDSSILSRCQKLEVHSRATLALVYARHGIVLGVLVFIVAFALMLR